MPDRAPNQTEPLKPGAMPVGSPPVTSVDNSSVYRSDWSEPSASGTRQGKRPQAYFSQLILTADRSFRREGTPGNSGIQRPNSRIPVPLPREG